MPLEELKVRARVRLNGEKRAGAGEGRKLRHCLHEVARETGFSDWEHARRVLGGEASAQDDMGSMWHAPACNAMLNEWHADVAAARAALRPGRYLLPFHRQFVVVDAGYVRELGVDPADPAWTEIGFDLVAGYAGPAWQALARQRLRAPRASFHPPRPALQPR